LPEAATIIGVFPGMPSVRCIIAVIFFAVSAPLAFAQQDAKSGDEAEVRDVIAQWYGALQKRGRTALTLGGRDHWRLLAPGFIDGGPKETETNPMSRALSPSISNELAAKALKFSYEIDVLTLDSRFAKAIVWERGYFYAWAAQTSYELAASALFIFEKQKDGAWLILAHEATGQGIPPNKITEPLPDMRDTFYATEGKDRDPKADAEAAKKF
jgi:hypothetical protein